MPEATQIVLTHKELVELLIKKLDIHEGIWGLSVKFGLGAANVGSAPGMPDLMPAAILAVLEIGLQKFDAESNLSLDASKVNPVAEAVSSS